MTEEIERTESGGAQMPCDLFSKPIVAEYSLLHSTDSVEWVGRG
jgi:hypothetical protein